VPDFPVIEFNQFSSGSDADRLLIFAAPAKAIAAWAGIPRKGWHLRMLYQRWVTPARAQELLSFWNTASQRPFILGPTALTIAIHDDPSIANGRITLAYTPPVDFAAPPPQVLRSLADITLRQLRARLTPEQQELVDQVVANPECELPDCSHDYVLESALQIAQMSRATEWFIDRNALDNNGVDELIQALEALCRPALVVDGQHRLQGAAQADREVWLPVVGLPKCGWAEQIYQFVVINEKAQRVETSLLTDIFGSSLTRSEQNQLRSKLDRSKVAIEERIAAVIAARDEESPFYDMVAVKLEGIAPRGAEPYIPEATIRSLIVGGRGTLGWRTDDDFYDRYINPTFPDRAAWETWTNGVWRAYWFAFWATVGSYYNEQAIAQTNDPNVRLWDRKVLSNLTKSVTLRLLQKLFMVKAAERVDQVRNTREVLIELVGVQDAEKKLTEKIREAAIPDNLEDFKRAIREWFLERGIPVRFFLKKWRQSLDDAQGQQDLWEEMEKAYDLNQKGKRYHTRNTSVFAIEDNSDGFDAVAPGDSR